MCTSQRYPIGGQPAAGWSYIKLTVGLVYAALTCHSLAFPFDQVSVATGMPDVVPLPLAGIEFNQVVDLSISYVAR